MAQTIQQFLVNATEAAVAHHQDMVAGPRLAHDVADQGIELVLQKQYDINTMKTKYRLDTMFGVVNKQPEMSGIILFSQT